MAFTVTKIDTTPFPGQKPGTSGLRKKVSEFSRPGYLENFIESTFQAVEELEGPLAGSTIVVGGDGRYFVTEALQTILKMAHAKKVAKVIVGQNGLFSTPAVSCIVRKYHASGAVVLTASHNPGGPHEDFGVKYNISNGGPAPESVTALIFEKTKSLTAYYKTDLPTIDLTVVKTHTFDGFVVDVIDPVADYLEMLRSIFDFPKLRALIQGGFKILIDCLDGVSGPYARRIFVEELGAAPTSVVHSTPLVDFGGSHPDPNLVYAERLVTAVRTGDFDFGAAFDGDADRNMILGRDAFFVTPSDSVAVIADHAQAAIPYFHGGLKGLSRSMPTGAALDHVAKHLGVKLFVVPTGWKFFGNLMDAGQLSVCGEESFGTGSDHIREKDGVWASLCWLSILAHTGKSVSEVLHAHWIKYGRNFFTRYDYENVESDKADAMIKYLSGFIGNAASIPVFATGHKVQTVEDFAYTDPTNGEVTAHQGLQIIFTDGSRLVYRLSGTGSSGATIRVYIDSYINDPSLYATDAQVALKPLVNIALELSQIEKFTGRTAPTVIT
eukprot:m.237663 g.237663  ORF g.237663 m.237663 type:complete len:553 (-) comp13177_c0_seq1:39-1697(-)